MLVIIKSLCHSENCRCLFLYSLLLILFVFSSEEAPASPSTRDAIQGMLSMANPPSSSSSSSSSSPLSISGGEMLGLLKEKGGRAGWISGVKKNEKKTTIQRPGKRPIKRPARHLSDEESLDEQETLGTCFKDSDYGEFTDSWTFTSGLLAYVTGEILWTRVILFKGQFLPSSTVYPSLESDEEDHISKSKMKRKRNWDDTPWSPKGNHMYEIFFFFFFGAFCF